MDDADMQKTRVSYGSDDSQFGDLRLPARKGPHPVIVVIHGGFWYDRYGLDLMDALSKDLTRRGYATWNIEYRRVGQAGGGWPGTLQDVSHAVDFLKVLAESYPLDLNRVVTIGHSAGGHLALWIAARRHLPPSAEGDVVLPKGSSPLPVHGAISLAGVADLRRMWEVRQVNSPVVDFLGAPPNDVPERYNVASPIELLPLGVPQVLVHGDADDRVPFELSDRYYDRAMELGDPVAFIQLPGIEHFKVIDPTSEAWPPIVDAVNELFSNLNYPV